jgi:uncharacterized membrane protein
MNLLLGIVLIAISVAMWAFRISVTLATIAGIVGIVVFTIGLVLRSRRMTNR